MRDNIVAFGRVVSLCLLIFGFIAIPQGAVGNSETMLIAGLVGLFCITAIIIKYLKPDRASPNIYVDLAYYLIVFILFYSVVYWNAGSSSNFNAQLTRLDAAYFAVGTLSTAGTGNLVPTSEVARALQGVQMLLDLGFFSIAVTLVVTRLSNLRPG